MLRSLKPLLDRRVWIGLALRRDAHHYYRLHFLDSALRLGLLGALRVPASTDDIAQRLGAARGDVLEALLDLGVALRELAIDHGRYRLSGRRARALAAGAEPPLAALVREWAGYHGAVFGWLPDGLRGAPAPDYLGAFGAVIAQSSRVLEPLVGAFARATTRTAGDVVRPPSTLRLLEIGCGSGIYLRYAAAIDPAIGGVGLDVDAQVARRAQANLDAWGIGDRFRIVAADARHLPYQVGAEFGLITLYNNAYYFPAAERPSLFASFRRRLVSGGRLAIVSLCRARHVDAAAFDLVLRATPGCTPLPKLQDLRDELASAGFVRSECRRLAPGTPLYGVLATA